MLIVRVFFAFLVFLMLKSPCAAKASPGEALAFVNPVRDVFVVESHEEVAEIWASKKGKHIVVHVDAHSDMMGLFKHDAVRENDFTSKGEALMPLLKSSNKDLQPQNYLNWSYRAGIVSEVWWVYPRRQPFDELFFTYFKSMLLHKRFGSFSREEIDSLKLEKGVISGTLNNIPFSLARIKDLPEFREPVILDIDCDYFVGAELGLQKFGMGQLYSEFVDDFIEARVPTLFSTISLSNIDNYLPMKHRYLGDMLAHDLKKPGSKISGRESFFEAERLFLNNEISKSSAMFRRIDKNGFLGGPVSLYEALIAFRLMGPSKGFEMMEGLVQVYPEYLYELLSMGWGFIDASRLQEGAYAFRMYLDFTDEYKEEAYFGIGKILFQTGEYGEALNNFILADKDGVDFLVKTFMAMCMFETGDIEGAAGLSREILSKSGAYSYMNNRVFLPGLVVVAMKNGLDSLARDALGKLLEVEPESEDVDELMGLVFGGSLD